MPADDCPIECKAYPYCGCGQERRFALDRLYGDGRFVVRDKQEDKVYQSWVMADMNRLVKLMNKMTGVSR